MENEKKLTCRIELTDDELDNVVGGVSIGNRVQAYAGEIRYCPGCNGLARTIIGTVVDRVYYEKDGCYIVSIKSDCCGYVQRALESVCSVQ